MAKHNKYDINHKKANIVKNNKFSKFVSFVINYRMLI